MSRIKEGEEPSADPDLTPMLDLVLNVLMFFITTTHLHEKVKHPKVPLPTSQAAIPLGPKSQGTDFLVISMDYQDPNAVDLAENDPARKREGAAAHVLQFGIRPEEYELEKKRALLESLIKAEFRNRKRNLRQGETEVKTAVIIRADAEAKYSAFYDLLRMCEQAGFRNLKLRAKTSARKVG